jgi:hypothetical protein
MASKKKHVFRYERDYEFSEYMQEAWPEHARRILEARRGAPFVRVYYPLVGFLFSLILAGGLSLFVTVMARQNALWNDPESASAPRLQWLQALLEQAVPVMWILTVVVVLIVLMACISAGLSKARELLFDAEKLELNARMEYMLGGARMRVADLEENLPQDAELSVSSGRTVQEESPEAPKAKKKGDDLDIPPLSEY